MNIKERIEHLKEELVELEEQRKSIDEMIAKLKVLEEAGFNSQEDLNWLFE